jgi:hypothetical protein
VVARDVSWSMPSRTSVTSLNITVAPARTSRSVQKPTAGFAVTPLNASLPPHCTPTTSSLAGQVSRRRSLRRSRCSSAVLMIESIIDMKPTCFSSCRQTTSRVGSSVAPMSATLRSSTIAKLPGRQQALRLQLLAAEADHHHLVAEIRIQADVAERPDRITASGASIATPQP